ncbi:MAG: TonB-dependent receptor [Flavobacteriaceae bacterium]|jgi:outer membrane cobalamin receptor|nr:TonB-dependent receptor [Flavobacteriaceae bacterium]
MKFPTFMGSIFYLHLAFFSVSVAAQAQQTVSGTASDIRTGEALENVIVSLKKADIHTHTSQNGSFILKTALLPDSLYISAKGYEQAAFSVDEGHLSFNVRLDRLTIELAQVNVTSGQFATEVMSVDLKMNPVNSAQDLLRKVSGLFIAQHAGGGKAEQIFLRGFDDDHGTDIAVSVDGISVNMVSHAHGQGYADLHFVIPETVRNIDFGKGAYYADKGDFDTGGYVNLETYDKIDNSFVLIEGGAFNSVRTMGIFNILNENTGNKRRNIYAAGEYNYTDGPFDVNQNFNRLNLFLKYNEWLNDRSYINIQASTFKSHWNASGQIPERAVNEGIISRWGSIDPTEGGNTSRTHVMLNYKYNISDSEKWQSTIYYSNYKFQLFSNFTFFLNNPENGDEIEQKENRNIYGMMNQYTKNLSFANSRLVWKSGTGFRYDNIGNIELNHVYHRNTLLDRMSFASIDETNLYVYTSGEWQSGKWMVNPALRLDYFIFGMDNKLTDEVEQGVTKARLSPKLNIFYNFNEKYQLFLKSGMGFHSNDTRVVIAQKGRNILPCSIGGDLGTVLKPLPNLLIQPALWYLSLQQEFVYVGDEAVVEPSGKSLRYGFDVSMRYQPLNWLYIDADFNYAHPRFTDEPKGENYIPLAPTFTSTGGVSVKLNSGFSAGLRYRYMAECSGNEDYTATAKGYFVNDLSLAYTVKKWEVSVQIQNLFDVEWNEAQFYTETRLLKETESVSDMCFTSGNPFFLKAGVKFSF